MPIRARTSRPRPRARVQLALEYDRCCRCVVRGGEDTERAVALGVDDDTAVFAGDFSDRRLEALHDRRIRARELEREPRRPLHVDEHEGDRSFGKAAGRPPDVEALGEEDREIVEDELGELTRCAERAERCSTSALDRLQSASSFGSRSGAGSFA